MNSSDDRSRMQGASGTQQQPMQGSQQQAGQQPGGRSGQQGSGQQGGQYGGQSGSQQNQYSPTTSQQGGMTRRGGSPSLFGGRGGPFEVFRRLDEDMDRLFNQLWGGGRSLMRGGRGEDVPSVWMPQLEVAEREGKLHVCADLPGVRKEDVKVSIEGDQLVMQGERRSSHEEGQPGGNYFHSERSYGSFYRSIPLPEGVDPQTVDASFRDGVLDVCFDAPRTQQQQARHIEIRDASTPGSATTGSSGTSGSYGAGGSAGGVGGTGRGGGSTST